MQSASRRGALYAPRTAWCLVLAGMQRWRERSCAGNLSNLWSLSGRIEMRREVLQRCLPDAAVTEKREVSITPNYPERAIGTTGLKSRVRGFGCQYTAGPVCDSRNAGRENLNFRVERQET